MNSLVFFINFLIGSLTLNQDQIYSILFIGDSSVSTNGLPSKFKELCSVINTKVSVDSFCVDGLYSGLLNTDQKPLFSNYNLLDTLLMRNKYDIVILQSANLLAPNKAKLFLNSILKLTDDFDNKGFQLYLSYCTFDNEYPVFKCSNIYNQKLSDCNVFNNLREEINFIDSIKLHLFETNNINLLNYSMRLSNVFNCYDKSDLLNSDNVHPSPFLQYIKASFIIGDVMATSNSNALLMKNYVLNVFPIIKLKNKIHEW